MNTYILQKDTPGSKAGDRYSQTCKYGPYVKDGILGRIGWLPKDVENNPEWFKLDEPKAEFVWTDELVLEFVRFTIHDSPTFQGRYKDIEEFKAGKGRGKRPWDEFAKIMQAMTSAYRVPF